MRRRLVRIMASLAIIVGLAVPAQAHTYFHPCGAHVSHSYVVADFSGWGHKAAAASQNGTLKIRVNHYFRTSSSAPWYPYNTTYTTC